MGQKINITTLRSDKFQFNSFSYNIVECLYLYSFLKVFEFFFWQKKIFLTNFFFFNSNNKIYLTFFIFFRVALINTFLTKKYIYNKSSKDSFLKRSLVSTKKEVFKTLFKSLSLFKKNLIIFKFINLNKYLSLKKKKVKLLNKVFKREASILFPRRFNFFLDFLQISVLFIENKINITFFIKIIAEIFRILQKKRHSRFLIFINSYFSFLLCNTKNLALSFKNFKSISGIKLSINGKLKGKPRSSHYTKVFGSVPIQTLKCNIEYARTHAFTVYGVFGLHLWIHRINV